MLLRRITKYASVGLEGHDVAELMCINRSETEKNFKVRVLDATSDFRKDRNEELNARRSLSIGLFVASLPRAAGGAQINLNQK